MCGCGIDSWCEGDCPCGCDHAGLEGQRDQAKHFSINYADMKQNVKRAEKRGFDNGVLFEVGRIREELDTLRGNVAFGRKPGYRQGFIGCLSLVRGIVMRPAGPSRDTS